MSGSQRWNGLNTLLTALLVVAGGLTVYYYYKADRSTRDLHMYQARAASLSPSIEDNALVLTARGDTYITPTEVTVEPIFDDPSVRGRAIPMLLETPADVSRRQVRFSNVVEAICSYEENRLLCRDHPIRGLMVIYSINGHEDGAILNLPGA